MRSQERRIGIATFTVALWASIPWLFHHPAEAAEIDGEPVIEVITVKENPSLESGVLVVRFTGRIAPPLAEKLEKIASEIIPDYHAIIIDMDSAGGELAYTERVAEILRRMRDEVDLKTYVRHGAHCLSACVLLFAEGEERMAGSSSSWLFHGVCHAFQDQPSPVATQRFLDLLLEAGVSEEFICGFAEKGYFNEPGGHWMSGYELFHLHDANIITRMVPSRQPSGPVGGSK